MTGTEKNECPAPDDWRTELVWGHLKIFQPPEGLLEAAPGRPDCGIGWLGLLECTCVRIENALDEGDSVRVLQIKEKLGTLRMYWEGTLSEYAKAKVEEAIDLAYARSACTCEICGEEGRLHIRGGWLATACADHAKGEPVPVKPEFDNLHITRGTIDGHVRIISCRRYDRATDSFVDVPPDSLGIEQWL
jgi:hypothetical protein